MLNGKFYTGLPPKMVDRQGGYGQNRQESHFFWPDDTRVDSAQETRVKRRNSFQLESGAGQRQSPQRLNDAKPDVDTRQMFHKEFAKSSIQFYDNLQPNNDIKSSRLLNRARREVTPKLTDVKPFTPPIIDLDKHDPSAAKRKQAYSSTIQFYDYVNNNDADSTQNNVRRPKMDMNNKREVELNTKNSPKLQVKHNVRHLSVERDQLPPPMRLVATKKPLNDGPYWQHEDYEPVRRSTVQVMPKRILKQQRYQTWTEDSNADAMLDHLDNGLRQLQLRSPAPLKKHVTYNEEAAEYAYYDDRSEPAEEGRQPRQSQPNMRTGSGQQYEQQQRSDPYVETGRTIKSLNNNNNKKSYNNYNEYNSNNNNNNNNNIRSRKILPKLPETTVTNTTTMRTRRSLDDTRATVAAAEAAQPAPSDPRKHLRSSLCFNGDALIVDVGAAAPSTSAAALARRSSAGRRVNVGLPD